MILTMISDGTITAVEGEKLLLALEESEENIQRAERRGLGISGALRVPGVPPVPSLPGLPGAPGIPGLSVYKEGRLFPSDPFGVTEEFISRFAESGLEGGFRGRSSQGL